MKQIALAFLKAQKEMANPKKTSANPFFKSKYADLNAVLEAVAEPLHNNGISILQPTTTIEGRNYVKTILLHESGETLESLTEIIFKSPNDAQAQGSGITYARRYGLQALCGVGAEDDDGNIASQTQQQNQKEQDNRPWLTDEGFNFLIEKGTKEQITQAFSERRMKIDFKTRLEEKFNKL